MKIYNSIGADLRLQLIPTLILLFCISSGFSQTWEYKDSGTNFLLYDLSIPPGQNDVAYAAGSEFTVNSDGIIIKTEDGGETWETLISNHPSGFTHIEFITPLRGFVVGWDNTFMITEDGGTSWQNVTAGTNIFYYTSLQFYDQNLGFAGAITLSGGNLEAYITTDGGETWTLGTDPSNMAEFAACFADANTLFSVGMDQVVSKSTDGGNTWTEIQSGAPTIYNLEVFFKDVDHGVVSTEDGTLLVTDDSGNSWNSFSTGFHNFYALNYIGDQIIAGGTDEDVYLSNDNGANWNLVHNGPPTSTFYAVEFFDNNTGLICGSQGTILKVTDLLVLGNEDIAFSSQLKTAYNPVSGFLSIRSEQIGFSEVEVFSIEGRKVLMDEFETTIRRNIDLSVLANGPYVLRISGAQEATSMKFIKY